MPKWKSIRRKVINTLQSPSADRQTKPATTRTTLHEECMEHACYQDTIKDRENALNAVFKTELLGEDIRRKIGYVQVQDGYVVKDSGCTSDTLKRILDLTDMQGRNDAALEEQRNTIEQIETALEGHARRILVDLWKVSLKKAACGRM